MRTMFYEFPEDTRTWELDTQYMYGSDILAAPIVEPHAMSRKVYLPQAAPGQMPIQGRSFREASG